MFFGSSETRIAAVSAFTLRRDDFEKLLDENQPDTLIGSVKHDGDRYQPTAGQGRHHL